jgi:cysteine desulfurase
MNMLTLRFNTSTNIKLPAYFDYAATTPIAPKVAQAMNNIIASPILFGNPSSRTHIYGDYARQLIDDAEKQILDTLNYSKGMLLWTSGATEANNLALIGLMQSFHPGTHLITTEIEHPSILEACARLKRKGYLISYLKPNDRGYISPSALHSVVKLILPRASYTLSEQPIKKIGPSSHNVSQALAIA